MPNAIITGASRGIGYALAEQLADAGWNLIIDGRDAATLHTAADRLRIAGSAACRDQPVGEGDRVTVEPIVGDITDPAHRDALIRAAWSRGRLDLLINNAGALGPSPLPTTATLDAAALREIVEVNVIAPLALTQLALPLLRDAHGMVIDLTSDAAVEGYPGWGGYGASKAATEQLRNVLAAEEPDVTVWRVDPGDVRTDMHQLAFPGEDISDRPLPAEVAPGLMRLLAARPPSGRHKLADPAAASPVTASPVTADPVTADPAAAGPVTAEPIAGEPIAVEPAAVAERLWLTFEVDDFGPSVAFYRDVLGLSEVDSWALDDEAGAVFAIGAARVEIERPAASAKPGARAAIEYPDLDALEAAHRRVTELAQPTPVLQHHRGHSGFTVHDPSGTEVYLWSEK